MEEARKRALVGECISRASVEAARGAGGGEIEAALAACDYERAATIAFACAKAGAPVGADVIGRILPGIELPAITCSLVAITLERARLVDALDARRFPRTKDAGELEAIVLYGAWRAGAEQSRLIPHLRRLSARSLTAESYALLATIASSIDDLNVAIATKPILAFAKEYAKSVATDEKAMTAAIDAVLAELPAAVDESAAAGFTVRAAKQVGRNEPCHCGSGLKYKKCHADKDREVTGKPSPIAGVSWDDFLGASADQMTAEHVEDLTMKDLARVNLPRVADPVLRAIQGRFLVAHEWAHGERVVAEAERRGMALLDDVRDYHVVSLLEARLLDAARPHIEKLPPELAGGYRVELAIADGPEPGYRALVQAVHDVMGSLDKIPSIDLAYSLLRAEPVIGILAARACIGAWHVDDPQLMLEVVEEVRDELNLPPSDAAWAVLDELTDEDEDAADGEPAVDGAALEAGASPRGHARGKTKRKPTSESPKRPDAALAESLVRIDQLERSLAATRSELETARTRPAAELMRAPEAPRGLEARVRELEALIREGNDERRELRKQLEARDRQEAAARDETPRTRPAPDEGGDDEGDALDLGNRELTIPRFERRFIDAVGSVPTSVASEAMRSVGTLCAGDGFAWRGVKQAKDMTRQVLMARVGIHHRLIFRVEDGQLDVLDLITREQLLTTLKRLRAKG